VTYNPIAKGASDWDVPVNAAFSDHEARIVQNTTDIATNTTSISTKVSKSGDTMTGLLLLNNPSNISLIAQANGTNNLAEFKNSGGTVRTAINPTGNLQTSSTAFITTGMQVGSVNTDFGNGTGGIIGIDDATASPNANPTGGVIVYSEGGVLKVRQSDGSVIDTSGLRNLDFQARDHGLEAWTNDPYISPSSSSITNGTMYVVKLMIRRPTTISNLWYVVTGAAVTPTASQNWIGLYNSAGTRLAQADIGTALTSSGTKSQAITPQAVTAGFVWVAILGNAATPATLIRGSSGESSPNINLPTAERRSAIAGTGLTALPASFTPSTLTTSNSLTLFAAVN
jgi:hypothetical protein